MFYSPPSIASEERNGNCYCLLFRTAVWPDLCFLGHATFTLFAS